MPEDQDPEGRCRPPSPMLAVAVISIGALAFSAVAFAHHGWGSYDTSKAFTITAKVGHLEWSNPHAHLTLPYAGAVWDVTLAPLSRMEARGLVREMIAEGQEVSAYGYPSTKTPHEMRAERITVAGKTYELR